MQPDSHRLENSGGLAPEELETIMRAARQQANSVNRTDTDEGIDWRLLGYVALGGSILVLLIMQAVG